MSRDLGEEIEEALGSSRVPRKTREQTERVKSWQPAPVLPVPDRQSGYVYRWVRVSSGGKSDASNVSAKLREGWEPVRIEEQPQFSLLVDADRRFKDNVEVAGLLLCKAPAPLMKQRREYFAQKNQDQMASVDNNFMRESDSRMPFFRERRSTTSFGSGR